MMALAAMFAAFGRNQQIVIGLTTLVVLLSFGLVLGGLLPGPEWLSTMVWFVPGMIALVTGQSTFLKRTQPARPSEEPSP
jgi:hypothetical protein